MSNRFILFFFALLLSAFTAKSSVQNFCQKIAYPLNPVSGSVKDVPHTIVKNTSKYFLLGYSDYNSGLQGFRPTFRIRDRFQNEIAGYSITAMDYLLQEVGSGSVYLTDISEIQEETESFFITGFVTPDYPNMSDAPSACTPFIAEIGLLSGNVLQMTAIQTNTVPYNILVNADMDQIVIVGEEFDDHLFNPMNAMPFSHAPAPGRGVILCVEKGNINNPLWAQKATLDMHSTTDNNYGSHFEKVSQTPYGYSIAGNVTMRNPGNFNYPYSTWIQVLLIDFNGNVSWEKSIKTSNSMSRATSSYYSAYYDRIFVLFHDVYSHSLGLFSIDPAGNHGPLCYTPLMGEVNPSNILTKEPYSELITVGGLLSNQMSSMGYSSTIFSPFYLRFQFDVGSETFNVNGTSGDDFLVINDGIDYGATNFSSYFAFYHNSFNMFDVDKRYVAMRPDEETYLFASKDMTYQSALLYKLNYDHCYCQTFTGNPVTTPVTLPDSPTVKLREWPVLLREESNKSHWNMADGDLICGDPDDPNFDNYKGIKSLNIQDINSGDQVAVYDILGRELYKGSYASFKTNASKYAITDGQILIVVDQQTRKSQKIVFVK